MANLFIGFPVPRAKIADMIAGEAPPLEHKTQHEKDGDDEMDVTGLVGAGGAAFPIRGVWVDDYNADATAWHKAYTGDGALSRSYDVLDLVTDDSNPSTAQIYLRLNQSITPLTWAKKRHLIYQCYIDCDDTATAEIYILSGWLSTGKYFGFEVSGGKLWGINCNGGAKTSSEIKTFGDAYIGEEIVLEAIFFPAEKVEFWVNGVLEQTSTTNLTTGTSQADYVAFLRVTNGVTSNNVELDFNNIQVYQEA